MTAVDSPPAGPVAADPAPPAPVAGALPPPPAPVRSFGPLGAVALAGAVAAGAVAARPLSLLIPGAVALLAVALRRPALLVVAAALAASALGARALEGLTPPPPRPVRGETVTLVSDPEARWGRVEAVARLDGRLVLLRADPPAAERVAVRLAGERLVVTGRQGPLPAGSEWLRVRHVAAGLDVREARAGPAAAPPWRAANHLRRLLSDGVETLGPERRSLFVGLVLGDDRDQSPEVTDDFRGSGLSHLLAVSGQNVAFVLAVAAPLLQRLGPGGRVVAVIGLLALFAVITRCEPSVLRAVAMAGVATAATARGRPTSGVHLLALAVAGSVLVDPLLVRSTGFQLSVLATAGIVVIGPSLHAALPGPPLLTLPLAVSASAQLGVAPLLIASFGGVPVVSLPANVLAGPAAALVMTWGLPAGLLAGLAGPPADAWLHAPTGLALTWLGGVARAAASLPLGELRGSHLVALTLALGLALLAPRARWGAAGLRVGAGLLAVAALAAPAVVLHRPPMRAVPIEGVVVWRAGGATVVVVAPGTGPVATLEGLRLAGVSRVDVLVVGPGGTAPDEERAARHRARVRSTWWLGRGPPPGAVRVGGLEVRPTGGAACVRPVGAPGACPDPSR